MYWYVDETPVLGTTSASVGGANENIFCPTPVLVAATDDELKLCKETSAVGPDEHGTPESHAWLVAGAVPVHAELR